MMRIRDLIAYLQTQDEGSSVGFFDHFGEFHHLTEAQIRPRPTFVKGTKKRVQVIVIEPPDFGEEPD